MISNNVSMTPIFILAAIGFISNLYHKLMRNDFYLKLQTISNNLNITIENYKNEASLPVINKIFDASFELNNILYLLEVHNMQKNTILKQKLLDALTLNFYFVFIIYCKNKYSVVKLIKNIENPQFVTNRQYAIKIFQFNQKIDLQSRN